MDFKELFEFAVAHDASDIHIQAGAPPMLRIGGQVRSVESKPLSDEAVRVFIASIAPPRERERRTNNRTNHCDVSCSRAQVAAVAAGDADARHQGGRELEWFV
jgi:Tfp pilus assembly pilus retraction ATPase PilT